MLPIVFLLWTKTLLALAEDSQCLSEKFCILEEPYCATDCDCDGKRICKTLTAESEDHTKYSCTGEARDCYIICSLSKCNSSITCFDVDQKQFLWEREFIDNDLEDEGTAVPELISKNTYKNMMAVSLNDKSIVFLDYFTGDVFEAIIPPIFYGNHMDVMIFKQSSDNPQLALKFSNNIFIFSLEDNIWKEVYHYEIKAFGYLNNPFFFFDREEANLYFSIKDGTNDIINGAHFNRLNLETGKFSYYSSAHIIENIIKKVILLANNRTLVGVCSNKRGSAVIFWEQDKVTSKDAPDNKVPEDHQYTDDEIIDIFPHPLDSDKIFLVLVNNQVQIKSKVDQFSAIEKKIILYPKDEANFSTLDKFVLGRTGEKLYRTDSNSIFSYFDITEASPQEKLIELNLSSIDQFLLMSEKNKELSKKTFKCEKCRKPEFLNPFNSLCDKSCPEPYLMTHTTDKCVLDCPTNWLLLRKKQICIDECPVDHFMDGKECLGCEMNTTRCLNSDGIYKLIVSSTKYNQKNDSFSIGSMEYPFKDFSAAFSYAKESRFLRDLYSHLPDGMLEFVMENDENLDEKSKGEQIYDFDFWPKANVRFTSMNKGNKVSFVSTLGTRFSQWIFSTGNIQFENINFHFNEAQIKSAFTNPPIITISAPLSLEIANICFTLKNVEVRGSLDTKSYNKFLKAEVSDNELYSIIIDVNQVKFTELSGFSNIFYLSNSKALGNIILRGQDLEFGKYFPSSECLDLLEYRGIFVNNGQIVLKNVTLEHYGTFVYALSSSIVILKDFFILNGKRNEEVGSSSTNFLTVVNKNLLVLSNITVSFLNFTLQNVPSLKPKPSSAFERLEADFSVFQEDFQSSFVTASKNNIIHLSKIFFYDLSIRSVGSEKGYFSLLKVASENSVAIDNLALKNIIVNETYSEKGIFSFLYFGSYNEVSVKKFLASNLSVSSEVNSWALLSSTLSNFVSLREINFVNIILRVAKLPFLDPEFLVSARGDLSENSGYSPPSGSYISEYIEQNAISTLLFFFLKNKLTALEYYLSNITCVMSCVYFGVNSETAIFSKIFCTNVFSGALSSGVFLGNQSILGFLESSFLNFYSQHHCFILDTENLIYFNASFAENIRNNENFTSSYFSLGYSNQLFTYSGKIRTIDFTKGNVFLLHFENFMVIVNCSFVGKVGEYGSLLAAGKKNIVLSSIMSIIAFNSKNSEGIAKLLYDNTLNWIHSSFESITSSESVFTLHINCHVILVDFNLRANDLKISLIYAFNKNIVSIFNVSLTELSARIFLFQIDEFNYFLVKNLTSKLSTNGLLLASSFNHIIIKNAKISKSHIEQHTLILLEIYNIIHIMDFEVGEIFYTISANVICFLFGNHASLNTAFFNTFASESPENLLIFIGYHNTLLANQTRISGKFYHINQSLRFDNKNISLSGTCLIRVKGNSNLIHFYDLSMNASLNSPASNLHFYIIYFLPSYSGNSMSIEEALFGFKYFHGLILDRATYTRINFKNTLSQKIVFTENFIKSVREYFFDNKTAISLINSTFIDCLHSALSSSEALIDVSQIGAIFLHKLIVRQSLKYGNPINLVLNSTYVHLVRINASSFTFCQMATKENFSAGVLAASNVFLFNIYRSQIHCASSSGTQAPISINGNTEFQLLESHLAFNKHEGGVGGVIIHTGTGLIIILNNIFQDNEASLGGVLGTAKQNIRVRFYYNIMLGNRAVGVKSAMRPYYDFNFNLFIDQKIYALGSAFYFRIAPTEFTFDFNSVREETMISFWHEENQTRPASNSLKIFQNKFLIRNKVISVKTTEIIKILFFSMESETFSKKISLSLGKSNNKISECLYIFVGIDKNDYVHPLPFLKQLILPTSMSSCDLVLSFKTFIFLNEVSYTCASNLTLTDSSISWNQLRITLQIEAPEKAFNYSQIENYLKIVDIYIALEQCEAGEYLFEGNGSCSACERYTFSNKLRLSGLILCEPCPESASYNCYGGNIRSPKQGYWQSSLFSQHFLRCPRTDSCPGDLYFADSEGTDYHEIKKTLKAVTNRSYSDRFCQKRYRGALCAECDGFYGNGAGLTCNDCSLWNIYITHLILILIRAILIWITVKKAFEVNYELSKTNGIVFKSKRDRITSSYLLKTMQEHFQHLTFLSFLPLKISEAWRMNLSFLIWSSSNDMKNIFSLECLLKVIKLDEKVRTLFFTIFLQTAFNVLSVFVVAILIKIWRKKLTRTQNDRLNAYSSYMGIIKKESKIILGYVFLTNIVGQAEVFFKMFFCYDLDGDSNYTRLISDFSIDCNSSSYKFMLWMVSFPMLLGILCLLPVWLFKNLYYNRERLHEQGVLKYFAYFYFPYEGSSYYFEICFIAKRIVFLLLQIYQDRILVANQGEGTMINLVFLLLGYLLAFNFLFHLVDPYKKKDFKIVKCVESISLKVLIITCIGVNIWWLEHDSFFLPFIIVVGAANLLFIGVLLLLYIRSSVAKIREAVNKLSTLISNISNSTIKMAAKNGSCIVLDQEENLIALLKEKEETIIRLKNYNSLLQLQITEMRKKLNPEMFENGFDKIPCTGEIFENNASNLEIELLSIEGEEFLKVKLPEKSQRNHIEVQEKCQGNLICDRCTAIEDSGILVKPISGFEFWQNSRHAISLIYYDRLKKVHERMVFFVPLKRLVPFQSQFEALQPIQASRIFKFQLFLSEKLKMPFAIFFNSDEKGKFLVKLPFLNDPVRKVSFLLETKSILNIEVEKFAFESLQKLKLLCRIIYLAFGNQNFESWEAEFRRSSNTILYEDEPEISEEK